MVPLRVFSGTFLRGKKSAFARSAVVLPLNQPPTPTTPQEPARAPRRQNRVRPLSMSGLPSSLSTLRPASLPMPSAMPRPSEHTDERTRAQAIRETMLSAFTDAEVKRHVMVMDDVPEESERELQQIRNETGDEVSEREAEILKLVAASMPSHRSAWKRDSGAWRTFIGRQKGKDAEKSSTEEDEDTSNGEGAAYYDESEDESEEEPKAHWPRAAIAQSLPIPIGPLRGARAAGLPSMLSKDDTARPEPLPAIDKASAAALRRASYAARDRSRAIDPGALDFAAEDDEEGEEDEEKLDAEDVEGPKSRRIALTIIHKRDSLPADGLWRSLA